MFIVRRGKTTTDIQNLELMSPAQRFFHDRRGHVQGLNKIHKISALTAHMETQAFDDQPHFKSGHDKINRLARFTAKF